MTAFRRTAIALAVAGLALGACGGDDDAGIEVEEAIGAPQAAGDYDVAARPSVSKSGSIDLETPRDELGDAAQAVVDLATSPKVGGFLVSSIVDLEDGYGSAVITVEVPSERFEQSVVELSAIGELTRHEMSGVDVTAEAGATRTKDERAQVRAEAAYSSIAVALAARRPPPAPEKPPVERALATARSISLAIASGTIVAAGAVVPVGIVVLALYLGWSRVARRLRVRWEA